MDRNAKLDILVWGATSSVGRLVAEYLLGRYGVGRDLNWALGGRSRDKLERLRTELANIDPKAMELPILIADAMDAKSLDQIVPQVQVVATTVGPYALYGRELVAACARHGADYCDLTGEVLFIRDMIDQHHAEAVKSGARLVPCCGFDSIPSDLGVLMMNEHMRTHYGAPCDEVKFFLTGASGGVGGGTVLSALHQFEQAKNPKARRVLANPYSLNPVSSERGPDTYDSMDARWDWDLGGWTGPFIMAGVNTRIVRRSNALAGFAYGKGFRYSEAWGFSKGIRGWLQAQSLAFGMKATLGCLQFAAARSMALKFLPQSGEGPSKEARDRGFFKVRLFGIGKQRLQGRVVGTSDPGHGETAKMFGESAVCLALDRRDGKAKEGGVLTPATAMGMRLVDRLRSAGMTFEVDG